MKKITFLGFFQIVLFMFILINMTLQAGQDKKKIGGTQKTAPSITVTKPGFTDVWCKGKTEPYTIKWRKTSDLPPKVRVVLRNKTSTAVVQVINPETDNDGSYDWKIPTTIPNGAYMIRVRAVEGGVGGIWGDSKVFEIKFCPTRRATRTLRELNKITITKPRKNKNWKEGETRWIIWKTIMKRPFGIDLYKYHPKKFLRKIGEYKGHLYPPGGKYSYKWTIPTDIITDGILRKKFLIRVYTLDTPRTDDFSERFYIKPLIKTSVIKKKLKPKISNRKSFKSEEYSYIGSLFTSGKLNDYDNKPGMARVGHENHYKTRGAEWEYFGYVFRSKLYFDLSEFKGKRGNVQKAKLILMRDWGSRSRNGAKRIVVLTGPWKKSVCKCTDTPGYHYCNLPPYPSRIYTDDGSKIEVELRSVVQDWFSGWKPNHGLLLIAREELFKHDNNHYVTYYTPWLEIEFYEISE